MTRNGGLGYCGDGIAEDWEDCDCYNGSKNCSSNFDINPRLHGNYGGYTCKNCKLEGGEGGIDPIACFNVNNGSISINKGEILPFYRNIERVDNKRYVEAK
ncbi:MAG: hypothetical protein LBI53_02220 [Candidatus Peribacteria bacterium]|nr:hypothetical protein [Candidatus Peribacteria bacterium]